MAVLIDIVRMPGGRQLCYAVLLVPSTARSHIACIGLHCFLAAMFFCVCSTDNSRREDALLREYHGAPCDRRSSVLSQPKRSSQIPPGTRAQRVFHFPPRVDNNFPGLISIGIA